MEIKPQWIKIHKALHNCSSDKGVIIDMQLYPITIARNGCRTVVHGKIVWMEQNQYKNSAYAARARAGEKITWGIPSDGSPWILIDFKTVEKYEQQNNLDHAQGGPGVHREMHPNPVQRANTA